MSGTYNVTDLTRVTNGSVNLTGPVTSLGSLMISGGTTNLSSGTDLSVRTLTLTGGTLTGADKLTVGEDLTWNGGTMAGVGVTETRVNGAMTLGGRRRPSTGAT